METEKAQAVVVSTEFTKTSSLKRRVRLFIGVIIFGLLFALILFFVFKPLSSSTQSSQKFVPPTEPTKTSSVGWKLFSHPSGTYTFMYAPDMDVSTNNLPDVLVTFTGIDSANNHTTVEIEKEKYNRFNRPFDNFVKEYAGDNTQVEPLTVSGLQADRITEIHSQTIFVNYGNEIYQIRFYNFGDLEKNRAQFNTLLSSFTFKPPSTTSDELTIVNGDVVVTRNGQSKTLTHWGYNSDPIFSSDKKRIAYISDSAETLELEKNRTGYIASSTNVWIMDSDGTHPIQVTKHDGFVYRDHLLWLDNDRLLFTDGEKSVKVYSISSKTTQNVLGPEDPVGACVDACGFSVWFVFSPDYSYLINIESGGGGYADIAVLDLQTLQGTTLPEQELGIGNFTFSLDNKTMLFDIYDKEGQVASHGTLNLITKKITVK